jgi:hypothetical protein
VQASVDGRPPVPMLIDLDAGGDLLSSELGSQVAFGLDSSYTTWRPNGERMDLPMGSVVSLALGDYQVADLNVGIWKGLDGTGSQGAISAIAFKSVVTTFDFRGRQIVIEDAGSFAERKRQATWVPFVIVDDRSIGLRIFAKFDFNRKTGLCLLDTYTTGIQVSRGFAKEIGGPVTSVAIHDAPSVATRTPNVTTTDLIYDCSVGTSFWADRALTIDVPNRALYVGG